MRRWFGGWAVRELIKRIVKFHEQIDSSVRLSTFPLVFDDRDLWIQWLKEVEGDFINFYILTHKRFVVKVKKKTVTLLRQRCLAQFSIKCNLPLNSCWDGSFTIRKTTTDKIRLLKKYLIEVIETNTIHNIHRYLFFSDNYRN